MSLKFIDIYNDVANQAWSMFDSDIQDKADIDPTLTSSINKALADLWASYPFPFRLKNFSFYTKPHIKAYPPPFGQVLTKNDNYDISLNNSKLTPISPLSDTSQGIPTNFYFSNNALCLYPIPDNRYSISINFLTLAYSFKSDGTPLFELSNPDDTIDIPLHLNTLFKNALITKTMLYAISSKSDEIYSGYKEQFEKAFRLLVKYSKSINNDKKVIL